MNYSYKITTESTGDWDEQVKTAFKNKISLN